MFGLNDQQIGLIKKILIPYAEKIEKVEVFGSRAQGKHRANSDIDLVLYGEIDGKTVDRIWTLLHESFLPMKADLLVYSSIENSQIRNHIDLVGKILFSKTDLL